MSESFENEFQKWLVSNVKKRDKDYSEVDGSDDDSDAAEPHQNADSETEENKMERRGSTPRPRSVCDQAPILVDDDDDDLCPHDKQQYEDEPPVLEPVPRQLHGCKSSIGNGPHFSPQTCIRNYSRNNQTRPRKYSSLEEKTIKTYSNKSKFKYVQTGILDEPGQKNIIKSKDGKTNGNIFDNMSSNDYEDAPPPLIPSPEALILQSDLPNTTTKYLGNSPDFCAMEADSTSEINGEKISSLFSSRRQSKSSSHCEVLIECDSTCMLAASPIIVSPASVSNSELEEARDPGGESKECEHDVPHCHAIKDDDSSQEKCGNKDQSPLAMKYDGIDVAENTKIDFYHAEDSTAEVGEKISSNPCPLLPVTRSPESGGSDQAGDAIDSGFHLEPPILSAACSSQRLRHRSRRKRHTIDSAETFSLSGKRPRTIPSPQTDIDSAELFDISTPPILTRVSETVITLSSRCKGSKLISQHSVSSMLDQNISCSKRQRHNTLPFSSQADNSSQILENLRIFVTETSELSQLQTHMHRLICHLFPHLKFELDAMSPESSRFENLLRNLASFLEQPNEKTEEQGSTVSAPLISCTDAQSVSSHMCQRPVPISLSINYNSHSTCTDAASYRLSSCSSQEASSSVEHTFQLHPIHSLHSTVSLPRSKTDECHQKLNRHSKVPLNTDLPDKDLIIPQMSRLCLKDVEDFLKPSQVLLSRDPSALLTRFIRLSCKVLQLLLPDLSVKLYSELAHSPPDLVAFIKNVILTNSRSRLRH